MNEEDEDLSSGGTFGGTKSTRLVSLSVLEQVSVLNSIPTSGLKPEFKGALMQKR